jgi:hypothetical protein
MVQPFDYAQGRQVADKRDAFDVFSWADAGLSGYWQPRWILTISTVADLTTLSTGCDVVVFVVHKGAEERR